MVKTIWARTAALSLACGVLLGSAGCKARAPQDVSGVGMGTAGGGNAARPGDNSDVQQRGINTPQTESGERYNAEQQAAVDGESLKAWRVAVAHAKKQPDQSDSQWQAQRDADEKQSMDMLKALAQQYPHNSTVFFMMGQVEHHFGKLKESAEFFGKSESKNTTNPLALFKLAETERERGLTKVAMGHFKRLLEAEPDFYAAKLGLAQCLRESDPKQAAELAQSVLDQHPDDPDAMSKAEQIVSEGKGGKSGR